MSEKERLYILDAASAAGRITHMTDSHVTAERGKIIIVENLSNQAEALHTAKLSFIIDRNDSATFLSSVLERMKTVIRNLRRMRHTPHAEYAALLVKPPEGLALQTHAAHYLISDFHICQCYFTASLSLSYTVL